MDKKEAGVSVVIGFVMVLAIFVLIVAIWAALGVPGQINEANYVHSFELENAFGDYQAALYSMYNLNQEAAGRINELNAGMANVVYSMLFPLGTAYNQGYLTLKTGVGEFTGTGILVDRLSVTFGNNSEIGFEGSGVFRRDGNSAHWIIQPMFDNAGRLIITNFDGSVSVGTNRDAALNTWYKESMVSSSPMAGYDSDESWDTRLWYEFFYEKKDKFNPGTPVGGSFSINTTVQLICNTFGMSSVQIA